MTHLPRTRDEAGRIRRPCPHCSNLDRQRYCSWQDAGDGTGVEVWNCDSPTCPCGSHSYTRSSTRPDPLLAPP